MAEKREESEGIVSKLRQVEVVQGLGQGMATRRAEGPTKAKK